MKFTLSWLRTHLETEATVEHIADTLSAIGLEVEGIEDPAATLGGFQVARILTAEKHPGADRLRVCTVDTGMGAPVQVVCGAPNARAGLTTVFAAPGTVIPATNAALKTGTIRGIESRGMLCSLRELGLGEEHDGIAELADGIAPPGARFAEAAGLDDPTIEIAVTPNRGDALAVRGIARDLAAAGLGRLKPWLPPMMMGMVPSRLRWSIEDRAACPWIVGITISGITNGPSPDWLQRRLRSIGLRPISALVDVTNFFTFDLGRPLHVFDADRITGDWLTLRRGQEGERFEGLNGQEIAVGPEDAVFADEAGVQSLAGVMGGRATGATDTTTSVFVESALFDPIRIARTGRRLGLVSDARQRFERGIDPSLPTLGLHAAARTILQICGGKPSAITEAGAEPHWQRDATLRFDRLRSFGGSDVAPGVAVERLEALGFAVRSRDSERVTVAVPPWRSDIAGATPLEPAPTLATAEALALGATAAEMEAECDLIEEVLRLGGLDAIEPVSLPVRTAVPGPALGDAGRRRALARRTIAARGFAECVSFSFMDGRLAGAFRTAPDAAGERALTLLNPIASDLDRLRPSPLASLLLAASRAEARGLPDGALFEIGPGFDAEGGATEIAAGLRTGAMSRAPGVRARPIDWSDARADAMAVLASLGLPMDALTTTRVSDADAAFHPGQAGVIRQGPRLVLARFGAIHPVVAAAFGVGVPASGFEIVLDAAAAPRRKRRPAGPLPTLQPVTRDFAFLVDAEVAAEAVIRSARGAERSLIDHVALFDLYRGEGVPDGKVSMGIAVTLQPRERTLTDAEIDAVSARIVDAVGKATGATLRG